MTRSQNQKKIWNFLLQIQEKTPQNMFFTGMSAAGHNDWPILVDLEFAKNVFDTGKIDVQIVGIEFNAAGTPNPIAIHTKRGPSLDVTRLLDTNQIEQTKGRRDE